MSADRPQTDGQLLAMTRRGDPSAFDAFYRRHREVVLAYCAQRVRDRELAADLMAETFAAALVAVHDPARRLPRTPVAWLFTIAHSKLVDTYRRGRVERDCRRRLELEPLALDDSDIARIDDIAASTDVARQLLARLPPDQFRALCARVLSERDYADIAHDLNCSESVVRKRVSRALRTLRSAIGGTS